MRCTCCNKALNDSESTRKVVSTGDYLDMCNKCYKDVEQYIPTTSRADLNPNEEIPDDWENLEIQLSDYDETEDEST